MWQSQAFLSPAPLIPPASGFQGLVDPEIGVHGPSEGDLHELLSRLFWESGEAARKLSVKAGAFSGHDPSSFPSRPFSLRGGPESTLGLRQPEPVRGV